MWRTVYQDLATRYNLEPNQPVSALRAQLERLKVRIIRVFEFLLQCSRQLIPFTYEYVRQ